jgi:hypothetical protein
MAGGLATGSARAAPRRFSLSSSRSSVLAGWGRRVTRRQTPKRRPSPASLQSRPEGGAGFSIERIDETALRAYRPFGPLRLDLLLGYDRDSRSAAIGAPPVSTRAVTSASRPPALFSVERIGIEPVTFGLQRLPSGLP